MHLLIEVEEFQHQFIALKIRLKRSSHDISVMGTLIHNINLQLSEDVRLSYLEVE